MKPPVWPIFLAVMFATCLVTRACPGDFCVLFVFEAQSGLPSPNHIFFQKKTTTKQNTSVNALFLRNQNKPVKKPTKRNIPICCLFLTHFTWSNERRHGESKSFETQKHAVHHVSFSSCIATFFHVKRAKQRNFQTNTVFTTELETKFSLIKHAYLKF